MEIIRYKYLDWLKGEQNNNFIKVLTGIRRVGKTTVLNQYKTVLKNENIIELDFNDARLVKLYDWEKIIKYVESKSKFNSINYVIIDEVQEINEFEKAIITLYSHKKFKYDIYITGSNSKMFSSELVTLFTGRVSEIEVFPISYKEILNIIFNNEPSSIVFNKYILQGGMGVVVSVYDNFSKTIDVLKKVYDGCLKKDIKNRHAIRNIDNVEKISKFLFHHIGRNISATNIENYLISNKEEKISKKTILNYFSWLTESYLFYKVNYYNLKGKSILNSKIKYYATDLGILTILTTGDINFNYGYRLENAVLLKLLEEGYEVYTGKDRHDNEIDFVVKKDNTLKYIQVCKILNDENFERESRSLLNMKDGYEKIILTTEISVSETKGIRIIHIESYLLNEVKI